MNRYKPGDKFLLEVTGVNDIGSRALYEVNGMAGLFSENVLDRLEPVESIVERLEEELKLSDKEKERCVKENPLQFDVAKGYANGIYNAIEIVKAGGRE